MNFLLGKIGFAQNIKKNLLYGGKMRPLKVLDVGGKDGVRAREEFYPGADITTIDLTTGWDVMKLGVPDGDWDVILANHFIEHIPDPDMFLDECRRVMTKDTVLNIGTPNLAAWYNRILFLFGYLPNHSEVSTIFDVGKFPLLRQGLGGHIYVYTLLSGAGRRST